MENLTTERILSLKSEIAIAKALNKEELEPIVQENISRYTGRYIPAFGADWDLVLNEIYPIIQAYLPAIFFRNPRAFLKPRNKTYIAKKRNPLSGQMEDVLVDSTKSAKTQEGILNYSLTEIKYKPEVRRTLFDALLFPYGILWHGYKGDFGMTAEQSINIKKDQVFVRRLSPLHFIKDPSVNLSNLDEARWIGRIVDIPLQDLVEDEELDVDKKLVKGFLGYGNKIGTKTENEAKAMLDLSKSSTPQDYLKINASRKPMLEFAGKDFQNTAGARFVSVYEIFLRPTKKEIREGKRGWIILLTDEQDKPLRVNEWKIKAEGWPTKVLQFNELADAMFGLTDVETYKQIADQKNVITNIQTRNAQENSKVWIGVSKEGANEEDIDAIQRGDQTILKFESGNPRDRMFVASPGGSASQELYLTIQGIQRNLDEKSGIVDLRKGILQSGEESATSVQIRNSSSSARPAYRQDIMADFLRESLHYINQLNKQFMPYKEAVRITGSLDIEWSENPTKEEIQADTDVEIDVISMLPENPQQEIQELNTILTLMVEAINNRALRQKLAEEGKTFNISPIIEQLLMRLRLRNPDIFRNIKPEESEGFVSVKEIREAKANVEAALTQPPGTPVPFPPAPTNDHLARLEVYTAIKGLLDKAGQVSDTLEQLIQIQSALLQEVQAKQETPNQTVSLKKPSMTLLGAG